MQKQTLTLLVGCLVLIAGGILVVPSFLNDDVPIMRWNAGDETDVPPDAADPQAAADAEAAGLERSAVAMPNSGTAPDERVDVILRGRVIDKFKAPVATATVWLDYGRGGGGRGGAGGGPGNRQRRVPDPVVTDGDGRFAFQGQTFRNLRVWLQVAHDRYALGQFDKDVGAIATEVDLGDLVLMAGGELRGRVTDLDGNGIPAAELRLQPENNNELRMLRDRDKLLPPFATDQNGYFRRPHLAGGEWSVSATAKLHTEGRSNTFVVEEDQALDIDDIRLGPGYEITGIVRNQRDEPIAKATVVLQGEARRPNGRGGPGGAGNAPGAGGAGAQGPNFGFGGGREQRTTTDAEGKFFLEHLPGTSMRLQVDAEGYLDYRQGGIDTTLGQLLHVAMLDGLRIEGRVQDSEGAPVTMFAFRATRLRGLAPAGQANVDINSLMEQMRGGQVDDATRAQMRAQVEGLREQYSNQFGGGGRRGPGGPGGPGQDGGPDGNGNGRGGPRDLGKPEPHPDGTFVATGLQEGVYEVQVQSPEYARGHSAEVELRNGGPVPSLTIALDAGVYVAGVVLDNTGNAIRGARVELRTPSAFEGMARGRGRNPGGVRGVQGQPGETAPDLNVMAREFMRMTNGTQLTLEATTNAEGLFIVKHAPRGTYRLQAEAKRFASTSTEPFDLQADRSGFELRLGALGSIAGVVRGLKPGEFADAKIAAIPSVGGNGASGNDNNGGNGGQGGFGALFGRGRGGGPGGGGLFQNVGVNPDGSYRVDDLVPGAYVVRCWVGTTQDLMREMTPHFMDGSLQPDAAVRGGEVTKLDLSVLRPQVGSVAGTVTHNGAAATGFQVELARQDDNGTPNGGGQGRGGRGPGGPGGFGGFNFGRTFQSVVAASGNFSIANVPPGNYRLRVQNNRRGGTLHEEIVQVVADATTERTIYIQTHTLRGVVTRDDGGNPAELNGRVSLLPGLTDLPENLGAWQRENPGFDSRLQNGTFQFESLKPGGYLLVVTVRGRERTSLPIVVAGDQSVTVAAGKSPAPASTPNPANPANPTKPGNPTNAPTPTPRPGNGR